MSYELRDSKALIFDAVIKAAEQTDATNKPVQANYRMFGHEIWIVPADTRISEFLSVCSERDPYRREEPEILRKAAAILKREKQHNSSQTCLTIADRLEKEQ